MDINVKPARWGRDFIKNRLLNINRKLSERELKYDENKLLKYYTLQILRHRKLVKLKQFIFIRAILPINALVEQIILKMNHRIWMFDWTYKLFNFSICIDIFIKYVNE